MLLKNLLLLHFIFIVKITSIWGYGYLHKKHIYKSISESLFLLEFSYNKPLINFSIINFIVGPFGFFVAKYIEKDLQKILKTILKAHALFFDRPFKKLLKARLPNKYYSKSHMEYYNFCQYHEDYFVTVRVKDSNYILFETFFCVIILTFVNNSINRNIRLKTQFLSIRKNSNLFLRKFKRLSGFCW